MMLAVLLLLLLGRAVSLLVYQMTWRNGSASAIGRAGALGRLMRRPQWWLLHAAMMWPMAGISWDSAPLLRVFATAMASLLALGAVGRFGCHAGGRFFMIDRAWVLLLAPCVALSPAFLYPCVVASCCLQYTVASWRLGPGYSNLLGFEFMRGSLCVMCACLAAAGWSARFGVAPGDLSCLVFAVVLAYQASTYVHHALAKSALGPRWHSWIFENRPQCMIVNAWLRGWTAGMSRETVLAFAACVGRWRVAICASVWLVEISWIGLFASEWFTGALLAATVVFHLVTFALSGLLTWHYIANHLLLIGLLASGAGEGVFRTEYWLGLLVSLPLTAVWIGFVKRAILREFRRFGEARKWGRLGDAGDHLMAWWDSPFMRMLSYTVRTRSGGVHALAVPKLSPYDTFLTDIQTHLMILGRHKDLDPEAAADRQIAATGVWGLVIDRKERDFLYPLMDGEGEMPSEWTSVATTPWVLKPAGISPVSALPLRDLFRAMNQHLGKCWYRRVLRWPHFPGEDLAPDICPLVHPRLPVFRFDEPVESVTLWRLRTFYTGDSIGILSHDPMGTIAVNDAEEQA